MADRIWYDEGRVGLVSGSAFVIGSETSWLANVRSGDMFALTLGGPAKELYQVLSIDGNTRLTLAVPWQGATVNDAEYTIIRNFSGLWSMSADLAYQIQSLVRQLKEALQNNLKGEPGDTGPAGYSILGDARAPASTEGVDGDWFINSVTWDMYRKESGTWVLRGNLIGGKGDPGKDGVQWYYDETPASDVGNINDINFNGVTGDIHRRTVTGWELIGNFMGKKGDKGDPARWHSGNGAPTEDIGTLGDLYLDKDSADVYQKTEDAWALDCNIKGLKGDKGDPALWLSGHGVPSADAGTLNDRYLDEDTGDTYGKASEGWQLSANIRGPVGGVGPRGLTFRGTWSSETQYAVYDAVRYLGNVWIAKTTSSNTVPPSAAEGTSEAWDLFVTKGTDGIGSGDMHTNVYDPLKTGTVLSATEAEHAATANSVPWSGVLNPPELPDLTPYQKKDEKGQPGGYAGLGADGKVPAGQLPEPPAPVDLSGYQLMSERSQANGYASLGADAKVPAINLPDPPAAPDLSGYEVKNQKGQANGYAPLDAGAKVPAANLSAGLRKRQLDLALPGKFAATVTASALLDVAKDYATWQLGASLLRTLMVRCYAADSGATPASVCLVVNGTQVGTALAVTASAWSTLDLTSLNKTISQGDSIEIGVSATGTNKDSENLRLVLVAEASS